jgi:adrenodoxin-NADP+ reductase
LPHYHALVFAYGASRDRELGLEGENMGEHIYSARALVGWYNGLPEYHDLNPDLTAGEDAVIIGHGNVALDVARILLTEIDVLRNTDITHYALETLSKSRIKNIHIVGRRGPLQAAFTIKEIRELLQLPNTFFNPVPPSLFPSNLSTLPRRQRRLLELLQKGSPSLPNAPKTWSLDFLLSPHSLHFSPTNPTQLTHIDFNRNQLSDPTSPASTIFPTSSSVTLPTTTLFRSIGYKSAPLPSLLENSIPFDQQKGVFPHDGIGRILLPLAQATPTPIPLPALYCTGWVKSGPTGVIATTMSDAFLTAEAIAQDLQSRRYSLTGPSPPQPAAPTSKVLAPAPAPIPIAELRGWPAVQAAAKAAHLNLRPVSWADWGRIDRVERERGTRSAGVGKVREKFGRVEEMLAVLD